MQTACSVAVAVARRNPVCGHTGARKDIADRIGFTELPIVPGDPVAAWRLLRFQPLEIPDPRTAATALPR